MTVSEFIKEHKSEYPDDGREFVAVVAGRTKKRAAYLETQGGKACKL